MNPARTFSQAVDHLSETSGVRAYAHKRRARFETLAVNLQGIGEPAKLLALYMVSGFLNESEAAE